MKKILITIVVLIVVLIIGLYALGNFTENVNETVDIDPAIATFEECVAAGYSTFNTHPEQCATPDGKLFVQKLPENELADAIVPIIVHGTFVCLPHWDTSGPQTLECAFGFLDNAGKYYVTRDTDQSYGNISSVQTNADVTVTGIFTPGSDERYQSIGTIEIEDVVPWVTETDEANSITFNYPETLPTEYVSTVDWPPQVQILNERYTCTEAGDETSRAGRTEERSVDDQSYCVTVVAEGAAGSVYRQYAYAFSYHTNRTMILTFSLQYPQCANYSEPQSTECLSEQERLNVDLLVDGIVKSIE